MSVLDHTVHASCSQRMSAGKALRAKVPRSAHAAWTPPVNRPDPLEVLQASDRSRIPALVPIRYGRMLASPYTFFRGAAAIMATDLQATPVTDLRVQACGDAHLSNFGAYATPERHLVFGVNDFDETLPGPWEWDVKRLATSCILAGRSNGFADSVNTACAAASVRAYRERMLAFAPMPNLDIWYFRMAEDLIQAHADRQHRAVVNQLIAKAEQHTRLDAFPKLVVAERQQFRIKDDPPLITHPPDDEVVENLNTVMAGYYATLADDRQVLVRRYQIADVAQKVVGVGSVGTRCYVLLLMDDVDHEPLFLQLKEAQTSVLEATWGPSVYPNHAQRVVAGQRLMQAASDIFLGWTRADHHDYYVRQLQDMKGSANIQIMNPKTLVGYAHLCGIALARAHARSGDAASIGGYLGKTAAFDDAITTFALAYATQTEHDYAALVAAVKAGRIHAEVDT